MKFLALLASLTIAAVGYSQTGNYFLSHFTPDEERYNITCFDIVQDDRGLFYFATQAGVLQFDGRNWDLIATTGALYSIARTTEGEIFVAGSEGFGKIGRDEFGMEIYQPLYKQQGSDYIFQIVTQTNHVYFLSENNLFQYSILSGDITIQKATAETGSFVELHEFFQKVYVSTEKEGLVEVSTTTLVKTNFGIADSVTLIFSLKFDDQYLLGTDDNRLYRASASGTLTEIKLQDSVYANASVVVTATWVNEKLIAVGTLRGGVIFINPTTGATEEIINYNTGLPDNEVFALISDQNQNVWAAHSYGFTRIAPYLPFRSYRYYPGLQGNLLCATTYKGKVYVGTSVGLFRLEKEEFYDEITYYVEVPVTKTEVVNHKKAIDGEPPAIIVEEKQSKKGLFGFLKKKQKEAEAKMATPVPSTIDNTEDATQTIVKREFRREKRVKKILRKAHFVYKPVDGVDSKIAQLIHWHDKLIAAGLGGVFEIAEQPKAIMEHPVRFLFASDKLNKIIVSTYDDKLLQFQFDKRWEELAPIAGVNSPVNYIFAEGAEALWFCGFDKIFRKDLLDDSQELATLSIGKYNFGQPIGLYLNNQVFIAASSGFYFYDKEKGMLVEGDTIRKPIAYFASASNLWFRDKHSWYTAGQSGGHNNLQLLNLFNNIRFIDSDTQLNSLWIITGNNELLQFNSEAIRKEEILYPLILKSIENNHILLPARNFVKIDQDRSAIRVEVVRPDFIGAKFVEYRYLLKGLSLKWSEWSTSNNIIDFPYLPTGEYKLLIQSRDIFGRVNELDELTIDVEPPYWKQTWFYAAEFSVFLFLVILSFRLSYQFIFISRVLSLLSIIIFIEFIQTIAGSTFSTHSTPVFDFVVQVGIAFVVLPLEGFLRRYFLQAITKRNQAKLKKIIGTDEEEIIKPVKSAQENPDPENSPQ
jgi:hypothetical protein